MLLEDKFQGIPSKYHFMIDDMYKGGDGYWIIEFKDGYTDGCGNNYIHEKTKKDLIQILDSIFSSINKLNESKLYPLTEASRNELLALAKSDTITRYNKSVQYKGFSIVDIDTTSIFKTDTIAVTCKVGDYYDTVELQDILIWIQMEAERNENNQVNTKAITQAIMESIDALEIKINCTCPDFRL